MKANRNSLHAMLYHFTYKSSLPNNLCPYFWKLVFALIVYIPNFIICLPATIVWVFDKKFREQTDASDRRCIGFEAYVALLILGWYLLINYHWIKAMFHCYSYDYTWANFGWAVNVIIVGFIFGYFLDKKRKNKKEKEKTSNIAVEFFRAKYYKYCPTIDWRD